MGSLDLFDDDEGGTVFRDVDHAGAGRASSPW